MKGFIMPNWCNNTLYLSHKDPTMLEKAVKAWNDGKFLSVMIPEPDYEGYQDCEIKDRENGSHMPDWWHWRIANWGTKWDIGLDSDLDNKAEIKDGQMSVYFDSAWSPPIQAYDALTEQGFDITAYYYESGCDFCGKYSEGFDECYTVSDGDFPEDIDLEMGISETETAFNERD
jgi:hypothetical protein